MINLNCWSIYNVFQIEGMKRLVFLKYIVSSSLSDMANRALSSVNELLLSDEFLVYYIFANYTDKVKKFYYNFSQKSFLNKFFLKSFLLLFYRIYINLFLLFQVFQF